MGSLTVWIDQIYNMDNAIERFNAVPPTMRQAAIERAWELAIQEEQDRDYDSWFPDHTISNLDKMIEDLESSLHWADVDEIDIKETARRLVEDYGWHYGYDGPIA